MEYVFHPTTQKNPLTIQTTICISNYVLHHSPAIWGNDHHKFNPSRWFDEKQNKELSRYLIPFSTGHRMCIGRSLAMTNILKTVTTLLREFDIKPATKRQTVRVRSAGIGEMDGEFLCTVSVWD